MSGNTASDGAKPNSGAASTKETPQERAVVAVEWLTELTLGETVANAALVQGRATKLEAEGITQLFAQDVQARVGQGRLLAADIQTARSNRTGATGSEDEARLTLIKSCGPVQSAAKRKFARKQQSRLKLYAAGEGVNLYNMTREQLLVAIPLLIQTAKEDGLSGVDDVKTDPIQAAFDAWNGFDATQSNESTAETEAREALKSLLFGPDGKGETGLIADRRSIQYAADAVWPPGTDIAIRREFKLQDKLRFSG